MICFLGNSSLLRIILWVVMETMRFYKAQTGFRTFIRTKEVPLNNVACMINTLGAQHRATTSPPPPEFMVFTRISHIF